MRSSLASQNFISGVANRYLVRQIRKPITKSISIISTYLSGITQLLSVALLLTPDIISDIWRKHGYQLLSGCNTTQNDLASKNTSLNISRIISLVYLVRTLFYVLICYTLSCFFRKQTYSTTSEIFIVLISLIQGRSIGVSKRRARMSEPKYRVLLK